MDERRAIERAAARRIWRVMEELTPSGAYTWGYWFKAKFGRTLEEAGRDFGRERAERG